MRPYKVSFRVDVILYILTITSRIVDIFGFNVKEETNFVSCLLQKQSIMQIQRLFRQTYGIAEPARNTIISWLVGLIISAIMRELNREHTRADTYVPQKCRKR